MVCGRTGCSLTGSQPRLRRLFTDRRRTPLTPYSLSDHLQNSLSDHLQKLLHSISFLRFSLHFSLWENSWRSRSRPGRARFALELCEGQKYVESQTLYARGYIE
jgi:hypothetical protein